MSKKRRMVLIAGLVMGMAASGAAAVALSGCQQEVIIDNVTGVYYGEANGKSCEIELDGSSNGTFSLSFNGTTKQGDFTYDGTNLNLTVDNNIIVANLTKSGEGDQYVLKITYSGTSFELGLVNKYTVSFKDGSSVIGSTSVVEGKTVNQPVAPSKTGYEFIGWYADAAFANKFDFAGKTITGATDVYARFVQIDTNKNVYEVSFDAGEGVTAPAAVKTVNGVVYNLPTVFKSGASFAGWWVSDYEDAAKLTYKYEGQELNENTTLFAVWESANPTVSVSSSGLKLNASGANLTYNIKITAPDGSEETATSPTSTYNYDFASKAEGDYVIEVTVNGNSTTAYYINKKLARVSLFEIDGTKLKWNAVSGAENYLITVDCGDKNHNHTDLSVGNVTEYDFANCQMQNGGIKFSVKAVAEGKAVSQSVVYSYERTLGAVTGLSVNSATEVVTWKEVENATSYIVEIVQGETVSSYKVVSATEGFSIGDFVGEMEINVYAVANGYNSAAAAKLSYTKARLSTPADFKVQGYTVSWKTDDKAQGYIVKIGSETVEVTEATYTLTEAQFVEGLAEISVIAKGTSEAMNSLESEKITVSTGVMKAPVYKNGVLSWTPVTSSDYYVIRVNGRETIVDSGAVSYKIDLTQKGANTVEICSVDADGKQTEWQSIEIVAYAVKVDANNNSEVTTIYKAAGDMFDIADAEKVGYTFAGWYDVKGGAADGGKKFTSVQYPAEDIEIYAFYTSNKYKVTLYVDANGELDGTVEEFEVEYGQSFTLPIAISGNEMKVFGGWYAEPNCTGTRFTGVDGKSMVRWNVDRDATIYAGWYNVLEFTKSDLGDGLQVKKGAGIGYVDSVKVPATYEGKKIIEIAADAFASCTGLYKVEIPDTVKSIVIGNSGGYSGGAFRGSYIREVKIYHVEGNNEIYYEDVDGVLLFNSEYNGKELKYIPYDYFEYHSETFTIPDGVETIPTGVFKGLRGCSTTVYALLSKNIKLKEIVVPASVTRIDEQAFASIALLEKVTFLEPTEGEAKTLDLAGQAFYYCSNLKEITLPARLGMFSTDVFTSCAALEAVNLAADSADYKSVDGMILSKDGSTLVYCPKGRTQVTIPTSVSVIGESAFADCKLIESVVIPAFITNIKKNAFSGCTGLTSLTFEGKIATGELEIAESAFYGCTGITEVTLPENLKTLGKYAFGNTSKLLTVNVECALTEVDYASGAFATTANKTYVQNLNIGANVPDLGDAGVNGIFGGASLANVNVATANPNYTTDDGVLFNKDKTTILYYPATKTGNYTIPSSVTVISDSVFQDRNGISSITIHSGITHIGTYAFYNCANLTSVKFENGSADLDIDAYAFANCKALKDIELPTNLKEIGNYAFQYCNSLTEVEVKNGIIKIGAFAFGNCSSLLKVKLPASLETIGAEINTGTATRPVYTYKINIFNNSNALQEVEVASENEHFATIDGLLYGKTNGVVTDLYMCPRSKTGEITIPKTVNHVWEQIFYSNEGVTKVTFESDDSEVRDIVFDDGVFQFSKKLAEVVLPEGLAEIPAKLFYSCESLEEINIPTSVTTINSQAFYSCKNLKKVNFGTRNKALEFIGTATTSGVFYGCTSLEEITLPAQTTLCVYMFSNCTSLKKVTLAPDTPSIPDYAFSGCTALEEINLADITAEGFTIGQYAFSASGGGAGARFTDLVLPVSLVEIKNQAFGYNNLIKTVTIPVGSKLSILGENAFYHCDNLKTINLEDAKELVELRYAAFEYCASLEELHIPASVKMIGKYTLSSASNNGWTFMYCTSLKRVYFDVREDGKCDLEWLGDSLFWGSGIAEFAFPETTADKVTFNSTTSTTFFYRCYDLKKLHLASWVTDIGAFVKGLNIPTITIAAQNQNFKLHDTQPLVVNMDGTAIRSSFGAVADAEGVYRLPDGVETIGTRAFEGQSCIKKLIIPSSVTKIDSYAFTFCRGLEEIVFEEGCKLTTIAERAFEGCVSLKEIVIPSGVTTLGNYLFNGCYSLEKAVIPATVTSVGTYMFQYCTSLTDITLNCTKAASGMFRYCTSLKKADISKITNLTSASAVLYLFADCTALEEVDVTGQTILCNQMFNGCSNLKKIIGMDSVKTLGSSTFQNCTSLEEIDLSSVTTISSGSTFYGCTSLKEADISNVALTTSNASNMFRNCTSLTSVKLSDTATTLGSYMFAGCTSLKSIDLPDTITFMSTYTFQNCTSLEEIVLPASVTMLGTSATSCVPGSLTISTGTISSGVLLFEGCTSLKKVTLPSGLTKMGAGIFRGCTSLESIELPETLTLIGTAAFANTGLKEITLPSKLASTQGTYIFQNCTSLTKAEVNSTITGGYMFDGCTALSDVTLNDNIASLLVGMFRDCKSLQTIKLPSKLGASGIGGYCFQGSGLLAVEIPANVTSISTQVFMDCENLYEVILNDKVTTIGLEAFKNCKILTSISLPAAVKTISNYAFMGSGLQSVEIPAAVTSLGYGVFSDCADLAEVSINANNSTFVKDSTGAVIKTTTNEIAVGAVDAQGVAAVPANIGIASFYGVKGIKQMTFPEDIVRIPNYAFAEASGDVLVIPEGVTAIGQYAFWNAEFKEIRLPSTLTTIESNAFNGVKTETVVLPEGLTKLSSQAFAYSEIDHITLPESLVFNETNTSDTKIFLNSKVKSVIINSKIDFIWRSKTLNEYAPAANMFDGCSELTSVTFGENVKMLGNYMFRGCTSLKSIDFPEWIRELGGATFQESGLESIVIPKDVKVFSSSTDITVGSNISSYSANIFKNCKNLKSVTLPEGFVGIGSNDFNGCTSLEHITLPSTLEYIGASAFANCSSLVSIEIPESVTYLGNYSFQNCTSLNDVKLPAVNEIGTNAFDNCTALRNLIIPVGVNKFGSNVFANMTSRSIVTIQYGAKEGLEWTVQWFYNTEARIRFEYVDGKSDDE